MNNWISGKTKLETLLSFLFGVIFVGLLLFLQPNKDQKDLYHIVISLAAAAVAAVIPGMLNISARAGKRLTIRAAGAMAVFVIIYLINPGQW